MTIDAMFSRSGPVGILSDAIAKVKFPANADGQPIYLAPNDEEIIAIALEAGLHAPNAEAATQGLADAVSTTLHFEFLSPRTKRTFFNYSAYAMGGYQIQPELACPPTLALSTLLTRVARLMGATGSFSSIDYYGRLATILGVGKEYAGDLGEDYRRASRDIWLPYTRWLESNAGKHGVPTLRRIGKNQYIGELLSQAVFAEGDARRIQVFLDLYGFSSVSIPEDDELFVALNEWTSDKYSECPKRVRELWGAAGARDAIVELLKHHIREQKAPTGGTEVDYARVGLRYVAARPGFREAGVGLSVTLPDETLLNLDETRVVFGRTGHHGVLTAAGDHTFCLKALIPVSEGIRDIIGADFQIVNAGTQEVIASHKRKENVYLFGRSGLSQIFEEKYRIERNIESLLLVENHLIPKLRVVLEDAAQEGWVIQPIVGTPGWSTVSSLVVRKRSKYAAGEFNVLAPRRTTAFEMFGGLRLESLDANGWRCWFHRMPPMASVVSESGQPILVEVLSINPDGKNIVVHSSSTTSEELIDFAKIGAVAGKYLVQATSSGGTTFAQEKIELVSARIQGDDDQYEYVPSVNSEYHWAFSAGVTLGQESSASAIEKHYSKFVPLPIWLSPATASLLPESSTIRRHESIDITVMEGDLVSIDSERVGLFKGQTVRDGARYLLVAVPGVKKSDGEVQVLLPESQWDRLAVAPMGVKAAWGKKGLAGRPVRKRIQGDQSDWSERITVTSLSMIPQPIATTLSDLNEAVSCIGRGDGDDLGTLAQLEYPEIASNALARHLLINRLEAEGNISVERDPRGAVVNWRTDSPCLLELGNSLWVGVGLVSPQLLSEAIIQLAKYGFSQDLSSSQPHHWKRRSHDPLPAFLDIAGSRIRLKRHWRDLALGTLPPISMTLPKSPQLLTLSALDEIDLWCAPAAGAPEWAPITIGDLPVGGALRIHHEHAARYAFVAAPDKVIALGSDHAKLLSGAHNKWNLAQIGPSFGGIVLPRSIKPLGLYGRILRLASAKPPRSLSVTLHSRQLVLTQYLVEDHEFGERFCGLLNG